MTAFIATHYNVDFSEHYLASYLTKITVPSLVVHATADACVYESDARGLFGAIAASDKELKFLKADHYLQEPADAREEAAGLVAQWVTAHVG